MVLNFEIYGLWKREIPQMSGQSAIKGQFLKLEPIPSTIWRAREDPVGTNHKIKSLKDLSTSGVIYSLEKSAKIHGFC